MTRLAIACIKLDGGTQSRRGVSDDAVTEYAEAIAAGADFPPVVVFFDGTDHWLADGFHRVHAFTRLGRKEIAADVRRGTRRDAFFFGATANSAHGLRRTNADKRFAVEQALREEPTKSDRWIADACAVSPTFVGLTRQLSTVDSSPAEPRTGRDGKTREAPKSPKRAIEIVRPEVSPLADEGEDEPDPRLDRSEVDAEMAVKRALMKVSGAVWPLVEAWTTDPGPLIERLDTIARLAREHFARRAAG